MYRHTDYLKDSGCTDIQITSRTVDVQTYRLPEGQWMYRHTDYLKDSVKSVFPRKVFARE
ncbi:hypothetical protein DPMN_089138 [Dreissena polymorpha]|uniref:Uncharacterized protein n=1 Tax=Dreissena polymorpha TaxID=45954 RepID=A0A9D4KVU2_DREPO|nr:hypothetical protein DPMN_089138 [Dreissena polymorpha]